MVKCKNCKYLNTVRDDLRDEPFKWCACIDDCPHVDIERDCKHYAPMTNADRIRSMMDEELADFLREFLIDNNHEPDTSELYEWLRKESEDHG